MVIVLNAILGVALLVAGRRIFWLFIAILGFVAGMQLANFYLKGPEWQTLVAGLVLGAIGAGLALFLERIAIAVAGFLAGGYILVALAAMLGFDQVPLKWLIYLVGAIIGVILVSLLFDWAIISLSALAGASLILGAFSLEAGFARLAFLVLVIIGVVVQSGGMRKAAAPEKHEAD
jgi:hypothetical protein